MSSEKKVLPPYKIFDAITLNATTTSNSADVKGLDIVYLDFRWSAGAAIAATIDVEYLEAVTPAGGETWESLAVDPTNQLAISGASGHHQLVLNGAGSPCPLSTIRVKLTRTAGTATMTTYISGKGV